jgi:hypothetical protein
MFTKDQDFTLSTVNDATRITFVSGLASGGVSALAAGDILGVFYLPQDPVEQVAIDPAINSRVSALEAKIGVTSPQTISVSFPNGGGPASGEYAVGNVSGSATIDWSNGSAQAVTLTANTALSFSNPVAGSVYYLRISQSGAGNRIINSWPVNITWKNNTVPVLSTLPYYVDLLGLYFDGTNYYAELTKGYNSTPTGSSSGNAYFASTNGNAYLMKMNFTNDTTIGVVQTNFGNDPSTTGESVNPIAMALSNQTVLHSGSNIVEGGSSTNATLVGYVAAGASWFAGSGAGGGASSSTAGYRFGASYSSYDSIGKIRKVLFANDTQIIAGITSYGSNSSWFETTARHASVWRAIVNSSSAAYRMSAFQTNNQSSVLTYNAVSSYQKFAFATDTSSRINLSAIDCGITGIAISGAFNATKMAGTISSSSRNFMTTQPTPLALSSSNNGYFGVYGTTYQPVKFSFSTETHSRSTYSTPYPLFHNSNESNVIQRNLADGLSGEFHGYVLRGNSATWNSTTSSLSKIDFGTDAWSTVNASLGIVQIGAGAVASGNSGYFAGGVANEAANTPTPINTVRKLTLSTDTIALHGTSLTEACILPTTFRS